MKRLSVLLASALCAGLFSLAATYNDTLKGFQTATPESDGVAVVIEAAGDLPGMGKVTFRRDGDNVTGGTWSLTVLPSGADAQSNERGQLHGSVTGGTLSFNSEGTLNGASAVQLTVAGGAGEYAAVSGGSGTLSLSASAESPSQMAGTLVLNF